MVFLGNNIIMPKVTYKYSLILLIILSFSACKPIPKLSKDKRNQYLTNMQVWQAEGRISITNATENITANFNWQQNNAKYQIHFYSPYSTETMTVIGENSQHKVIASNADGKEEVTLEQNLPFMQLSYWLKGIFAPNSTVQQICYDEYNQISKLQQDDWSIEYQSYLMIRPASLPTKLTITDGVTKAKLIVKDWKN